MGNRRYLWEKSFWPEFTWELGALLEPLGQCRRGQGLLMGQLRDLGFELARQAQAEILVEDAVKTAEIEGEHLDPQAVRSSVARRLGLAMAGLPVAEDPRAKGMVEILLDATTHFNAELTAERLFSWHGAMFPGGYSGLRPIRVGAWRDDREGPMQVVSGPVGRGVVHYEAPPATQLDDEMGRFLAWWLDSQSGTDGFIRAGVAHLRFAAIHPFEDGNGRIARALTDMALAQDEDASKRFYSLSSQIMRERDAYYEAIKETNFSDGDITAWLVWFLQCTARAMERSDALLVHTLRKSKFWNRHAQTVLNERQIKVVNRLFDAGPEGLAGGLKNRKYVGIAKTSRATAQRELADLVKKGILKPRQAGARNVTYDLILK